VATTEGSIFNIIGREYVDGTLSTTSWPKVVFATGVYTPALDVETMMLSRRFWLRVSWALAHVAEQIHIAGKNAYKKNFLITRQISKPRNDEASLSLRRNCPHQVQGYDLSLSAPLSGSKYTFFILFLSVFLIKFVSR
jgi:hypothetical protein